MSVPLARSFFVGSKLYFKKIAPAGFVPAGGFSKF